jgi:uncharacterized coiled-coil protein SlyX
VNDTEERIVRLEERYTHLQHHVTEQDRVILALREEVEQLTKALAAARPGGSNASPVSDDMPADERPPHY